MNGFFRSNVDKGDVSRSNVARDGDLSIGDQPSLGNDWRAVLYQPWIKGMEGEDQV